MEAEQGGAEATIEAALADTRSRLSRGRYEDAIPDSRLMGEVAQRDATVDQALQRGAARLQSEGGR